MEAQKRAQQQSKLKQAEDAITARQQEESRRKAELEKQQKEAAEKKREEELNVARLNQEEEKKKAELEAKKTLSENSRNQTGVEWKKWVDVQKGMKVNVIEPVKKQKEVKQGLRGGMRLITRGLGQVVNTKESILRVVSPFLPIFAL